MITLAITINTQIRFLLIGYLDTWKFGNALYICKFINRCIGVYIGSLFFQHSQTSSDDLDSGLFYNISDVSQSLSTAGNAKLIKKVLFLLKKRNVDQSILGWMNSVWKWVECRFICAKINAFSKQLSFGCATYVNNILQFHFFRITPTHSRV